MGTMITKAMKTSKEVILRPIRPNAGVHAKYRARMDDLLRSVRNDVLAALKAYGLQRDVTQDVSALVAADAAPLVDAVTRLMIGWLEKLENLAGEIAREFVKGSARSYDGALKAQLRKSGFTVRLQLTEYTREAREASVGMNTGLIKSIPTEYLADVSKYVNEAVSAGFDLATLTNNLQHAYNISRNRAKLIARDQSNKATAAIEQARRQELGVTEAIWMHSHGAKVPRASHVKANGKRFRVSEGMLIDGEYILPGQKINCGCTSRSVLTI